MVVCHCPSFFDLILNIFVLLKRLCIFRVHFRFDKIVFVLPTVFKLLKTVLILILLNDINQCDWRNLVHLLRVEYEQVSVGQALRIMLDRFTWLSIHLQVVSEAKGKLGVHCVFEHAVLLAHLAVLKNVIW